MSTKTQSLPIIHWQLEFVVVVRVPINQARHTEACLIAAKFEFEQKAIAIDRSVEFSIVTSMKNAGEVYKIIMEA